MTSAIDGSSLTCDINPSGVADAYLESLNQCFPGWGDASRYVWSFERQVGARRADLMVLRDGDEWLAGSAVTYRKVRFRRGTTALVGIMTASWTLPPARGRGCFTRIIAESEELVRGHRGALLLAFVTLDNASSRRLVAAGSATFDSAYIVSEAGQRPAMESSVSVGEFRDAATDPELEEILRLRERSADGHARFAYDVSQWRSQMLDRGDGTYALRLGELGFAVMETHGTFERVQATALHDGSDAQEVLVALWTWARTRGRELFLFSMQDEVRRAAVSLGLTVKPGYLTALIGDPGTLGEALGLEEEFVSPAAAPLADPESSGYAGPWFLESGDRM